MTGDGSCQSDYGSKAHGKYFNGTIVAEKRLLYQDLTALQRNNNNPDPSFDVGFDDSDSNSVRTKTVQFRFEQGPRALIQYPKGL